MSSSSKKIELIQNANTRPAVDRKPLNIKNIQNKGQLINKATSNSFGIIV
jgi:hypothetical protein